MALSVTEQLADSMMIAVKVTFCADNRYVLRIHNVREACIETVNVVSSWQFIFLCAIPHYAINTFSSHLNTPVHFSLLYHFIAPSNMQ